MSGFHADLNLRHDHMAEKGEISLKDLIKEANINTEDLDRRCTEEDFHELADLCDPWEQIGSYLGLPQSKINAIKEDHNCAELRRIQTLREWKERDPIKATYRTLIEAFVGCNKNNTALKICEKIGRDKASIDQASAEACFFQISELSPVQNDILRTLDRLESLLDSVQMQLAKDATLDELKLHVCTSSLITRCVGSHLRRCNDVPDFFNELKQYCNAICYDILEELVKELGDKDAKTKMEAFIRECKPFQKSTKLKDLVDIYKGPTLPQCYKQLEMKLGSSWHEKTLEDLETFRRRRISCKLWLLKLIGYGSLIVTYFVPLDDILELKHIGDRDVVHIKCGEEYIFSILLQQMYDAVSKGDLQKVKSILKESRGEVDLDTQHQDGKTVLVIAAENGDELILLTLLDNGADITSKQEKSGRTALFFAVENGHEEAAAILLAYGADPHQTDSNGVAAYDVVKKENKRMLEVFQRHLSQSRKQPARSITTRQWLYEKLQGWKSALFGQPSEKAEGIIEAARSDDIANIEQIILEHQSEEDLRKLIRTRDKTKDGWTALMWACEIGNPKIVELLLQKGADPNDSDVALSESSQTDAREPRVNEWTCLMLASHRGHLKVAKMLLDYHADPNLLNKMNVGPLSMALHEGFSAVALLLIHRGADISISDENGWTPLIRASSKGNLTKLVKVIADGGANINAQTKEGWSSVMVASHYGYVEMVEELGKRGADLNLVNSAGDTALHIATLRNRHTVVKQLVDLKAKFDLKINVENKDGLTALMIANDRGYHNIVDILVQGGAKQGYSLEDITVPVNELVERMEKRAKEFEQSEVARSIRRQASEALYSVYTTLYDTVIKS